MTQGREGDFEGDLFGRQRAGSCQRVCDRVSSELNDVGRSLERARDQVRQLKSRAAATDELIDSGRLTDLTAAPDSDLDRELTAHRVSADVERQLTALKVELLPASARQQLEGRVPAAKNPPR